MVKKLAVARKRGLDLALEETLRLRVGEPLVAFGRIGVRLRTRDAEQVPDYFGGLTHVQFSDRISQPALKPDDRLEVGRARFQRRHDLGADTFGAGESRKPAHAARGPDQRRVT